MADTEKVLHFLLTQKHFLGWKTSIANAAAKELNLKIKFNNKKELLAAYKQYVATLLLEKLSKLNIDNFRTGQKIQAALQIKIDIIDQWKEAEKLAIQSTDFSSQLQYTASLSDKIWRWAGDTSTDYNFYTKRLILGGIMMSSQIFWLEDSSQSSEKTKEFIQNRIDETAIIGIIKKELKEHTKEFHPILKALKDTYFSSWTL